MTKGSKENWGSDGYVHCLDCDDVFTVTYLCENLSSIILVMCSLLYINEET